MHLASGAQSRPHKWDEIDLSEHFPSALSKPLVFPETTLSVSETTISVSETEVNAILLHYRQGGVAIKRGTKPLSLCIYIKFP